MDKPPSPPPDQQDGAKSNGESTSIQDELLDTSETQHSPSQLDEPKSDLTPEPKSEKELATSSVAELKSVSETSGKHSTPSIPIEKPFPAQEETASTGPQEMTLFGLESTPKFGDRGMASRGSKRSSAPSIGKTRLVTPGSDASMPALKQRARSRASGLPTPSEGARGGRTDPLISLMDTVFLAGDSTGSGWLEEKEFWRLLQSPLLNLKLTSEDVRRLRARVDTDKGAVNYVEFLSRAKDLIRSLYQDRPRSSSTWTMLVSLEGEVMGYLNKNTLELRSAPPEGVTVEEPNLIEDTVFDFLEVIDPKQAGIISEKMFVEGLDMIQSGAMGLIITPEELEEIKQIFRLRKDKVPYEDFIPVLLELICRTYQVKDSSHLNWVQLDSSRVGNFWFNKRTGRSKRVMPPEFQELHQMLLYQQQERSHEMTFVQQTIHDLEAANQEIQTGRVRIGQLENQVAILNEEMETVMVQLDETGTTLDETTARLQGKSSELETAKGLLSQSELERGELRGKLRSVQQYCDEIEELKGKVTSLQSETHDYSRVVHEKEGSVSELRRELQQVVGQLREAERSVEEKDSRLDAMETDVRIQLARTRDLEEELLRVTELESKLGTAEGLLEKTEVQLDEKNSALGHARKSLQLARQRNQELDDELQHMSELREKLHHSRCEINTLKSLLASKTSLVQARDSEIERSDQMVRNLRARDEKRAQVLSVVLEQTARIHQEQKQSQRLLAVSNLLVRPSSAGRQHERTFSAPNTLPSPLPDDTPKRQRSQAPRKRITAESRNKSFVGVLPQIDGRPAGPRKRSKAHFTFSNNNELRNLTRLADASIKKDSELLNVTFFDDPPPPKLNIGDRVLVDISKPGLPSLSPKGVAGTVRYVGKVDSVYIDNRYFVGVKLDEPIGDCDGTRKGKRYFMCQPQHGLLVLSDRVVAVLDKTSLKFIPVHARDANT